MNKHKVRERREKIRAQAAEWNQQTYNAMRVAVRLSRGEKIADDLFIQFDRLPMMVRYKRRSLIYKWVDYLASDDKHTVWKDAHRWFHMPRLKARLHELEQEK